MRKISDLLITRPEPDVEPVEGFAWAGHEDGAQIPPPVRAAPVVTTTRFQLLVPGHPRTKGSLAVRNASGKARLSDTEASRKWLKHMAEHARRGWDGRDPIAGPVVVTAWFRYWRPDSPSGADPWPTGGQFGDVDKLIRNVLDALQLGRVIDNDRQVVDGREIKSWAAPGERAGVVIHVSEVLS